MTTTSRQHIPSPAPASALISHALTGAVMTGVLTAPEARSALRNIHAALWCIRHRLPVIVFRHGQPLCEQCCKRAGRLDY